MPDGGEFAHPAGIIFVTKDKIVSRYLSGVIFDPKDFKLALLEASEGTVGKFHYLIRFCFTAMILILLEKSMHLKL